MRLDRTYGKCPSACSSSMPLATCFPLPFVDALPLSPALATSLRFERSTESPTRQSPRMTAARSLTSCSKNMVVSYPGPLYSACRKVLRLVWGQALSGLACAPGHFLPLSGSNSMMWLSSGLIRSSRASLYFCTAVERVCHRISLEALYWQGCRKVGRTRTILAGHLLASHCWQQWIRQLNIAPRCVGLPQNAHFRRVNLRQ